MHREECKCGHGKILRASALALSVMEARHKP